MVGSLQDFEAKAAATVSFSGVADIKLSKPHETDLPILDRGMVAVRGGEHVLQVDQGDSAGEHFDCATIPDPRGPFLFLAVQDSSIGDLVTH